MEFSVCVMGDQDQAMMFDDVGFRPFAIQAIHWAREQLDSTTPAEQNRHWDFLGEMPRMHAEGDVPYVHGSPREPTSEKVYPEDIREALLGDEQVFWDADGGVLVGLPDVVQAVQAKHGEDVFRGN